MKNFFQSIRLIQTLIMLACFSTHLQAQYTSFFHDDFDSNTSHWFVGDVKKSSVELKDGAYSFYNDEGKSPIVPLIDLPFDEHKNYKISADLKSNYIPYETSRFGVLFAAKDERNGYAVLLNEWSQFYFVKIDGGKIKEIYFNVNSGKGMTVKIILEDWRWKFMMDDSTIYTCKPLPWMGHKVGFYSDQADFSANNLTIEEAPATNPCPLPFTQQNFNDQFGKILCSAAKNFNDIKGEEPTNLHGDSIWLKPTASVNGAVDVSIVKLKGSIRQYIIPFMCTDSMSLDNNERMFDEITDAINNMPNSCYKLNQNPVIVNPNVSLKKDVQWLSTINGKPLTMIELALHATSYYEVVIHVYEE